MSSVFWILNVALIEQFITADHCQITGQERQQAMKMPRIKRDQCVCHSSICNVLFYLI